MRSGLTEDNPENRNQNKHRYRTPLQKLLNLLPPPTAAPTRTKVTRCTPGKEGAGGGGAVRYDPRGRGKPESQPEKAKARIETFVVGAGIEGGKRECSWILKGVSINVFLLLPNKSAVGGGRERLPQAC
ncbi:hypothetical protein PDIP_59990 [Penicillium digitatum Pd1]|uniref:Uncharacterized protein n=1 Tax=Penicillium digitatum (strain Pd1 / CECT 20795) TaxID=1170230 RepID=K9FQ49_PEND1|nr:hypothetical protein PDIP_59990 [Penicillium digitatum Pd1]EKV10497.1 hypothetical protein PDIP_59990 [Penicillium digitatum Pd1]